MNSQPGETRGKNNTCSEWACILHTHSGGEMEKSAIFRESIEKYS